MDKGGMDFRGMDSLIKEIESFGPTVANKGGRTGVRKTLARVRSYYRRQVPREKGTLRKAVRTKMARPKYGAVGWVGIKRIPGESKARNYYTVLEKGRKPYRREGRRVAGSPPSNQGAYDRVVRYSKVAFKRYLRDEVRTAVYQEAGKALARQRLKR